ncbi:MAG: hypothetical protein MR489_09405 [Prevotella sp.]|nr:hypothetical protein [Prevotella sp.]
MTDTGSRICTSHKRTWLDKTEVDGFCGHTTGLVTTETANPSGRPSGPFLTRGQTHPYAP